MTTPNTDTLHAIFCAYVQQTDAKPRHTAAAEQEADSFATFCDEAFPDDQQLQSDLYSRMMDCAAEHEESGFIAGFKCACALRQLFE